MLVLMNLDFIEVLKAHGIVPAHVGQKRPAAATPSATLDDHDNSDQDEDNTVEIKALEVYPFLGTLCFLLMTLHSKPPQERLRALKNKEGRKLKKVKLEKGNQVEVKKESGSQRLGEVIDLT